MKIQKLLLCFLAAGAILTGCWEEEPLPTIPALSVGQSEINFEQGGGTATLTVTSNRAWSITSEADWLAFSPAEGAASDAPVSVTITALNNAGSNRVSSFKVKTAFDYKTITVSQPGAKGEDPNTNPTGSGTKDDPYNVIAALKAVENLTWTSNDDYQSTDYVYVKGKISRIADKGTYTDGGTYGNATFWISPDGSTVNEFEVYRALYLGNKRYTSGQRDIQVGDEVIIYGKLMNYRGNTPETVSGTAYLYSLNGETDGGGGDAGDPKGTGTAADPYNPAAAIAAVANLTWTDKDNYQNTDIVYVKGKISRIADNGTYTEGGSYGNATFWISEDGGTNGEFYVFRALYLGNKKYASGQTDIKVGDEVIVCGKLMNYRNNTPETVSGTAYLYSLNGETGGGGGSQGEPKGTGTLADPYNPAGAAAAVANLTWTDKDNYQTTDVVYVKGKISRIADSGTFAASGNYGNASFYIVEEGTDYEFYVFQTYYLGNKKYESGQTDIKVGDEVIICGKLMNYKGNTPETVGKGGSYVYSLNGETDGGGGSSDDYENATKKSVAEFISTADEDTYFKLTGTVSNFNANYCSFDLTDETGKIYVYSVANKSDWTSKISNGGTVTLAGKYLYYQSKDQHEVVDAYILSFEGEGGGDSGEVKNVTVAEFIAAEKSTTQPYKLTGTVSNIKSDVYGNFDLTDETGTVYIYGLVSKDLGGYAKNKANDKSFSSIGIKEGDKITIVTYRDEFTKDGSTTIEGVGGYYVSGASGGGEGGGEEDGHSAGDGSVVTGNVETVTFANCGLSNGTQYKVINGTKVKISFGDGNNDGKYYTTGTGMRIYGDGYVQIASDKSITKIVYTFQNAEGQSGNTDYKTYPISDDYSVNSGTITLGSAAATWTGSATSVKLARKTGNGHWRLQKVEVTLAE